jgi:hypothetical protein
MEENTRALKPEWVGRWGSTLIEVRGGERWGFVEGKLGREITFEM